MLIQGVMMNFAYDQNTTIQSLKSLGDGVLENILDAILNGETLQRMDKDFEIKRLVIGFSGIVISPNATTLDQSL